MGVLLHSESNYSLCPKVTIRPLLCPLDLYSLGELISATLNLREAVDIWLG